MKAIGATVGAALRGRPSFELAQPGGHRVPPLQLWHLSEEINRENLLSRNFERTPTYNL